MTKNQHESEYFMQLSWIVVILLTLKEWNKHIILPIVVDPSLLIVNLKNLYDPFRTKRPKPSF